MNMRQITIKIMDISDSDGTAFKAVIPELNNSIIYADTMREIFKLVPEAIAEAKNFSFGIYADSAGAGRKACATGRKKGAKQLI